MIVHADCFLKLVEQSQVVCPSVLCVMANQHSDHLFSGDNRTTDFLAVRINSASDQKYFSPSDLNKIRGSI
jgi:hypothetical protein